MAEASNDKQQLIDAYRRRAPSYDLAVRLFDIFAWFGFNISGWRKQAVSELGLKAGDTVVDIGCGTGLNFPLLHRAVGPQGMIIGVDLSDAMLTQARHTAEANHWANVQLVCADASQFEFPPRVNAVLSTYTLTLVPDPERVVSNATAALTPGGRLVVLDMAWPRHCPLWWRHVLFFLRSYGVTAEVLRRRPWETVQKAMEERLRVVSGRQFWFGFFYLASGAAPDPMDQPKVRADDDPSETIIAMERAALDRWGRGDPSGFLEISAPDVVYFDPSLERRIDGRAALSRYYEALRGKVSISRYELINPRVQRVGDAAVLTFNYVSYGGAEGAHRWNCTEVYRRSGDRWEIIQTHWSYTKAVGA